MVDQRWTDERTADDAPVNYSHSEAHAWAAGWNAAVHARTARWWGEFHNDDFAERTAAADPDPA